jgi:hypothetical protein
MSSKAGAFRYGGGVVQVEQIGCFGLGAGQALVSILNKASAISSSL